MADGYYGEIRAFAFTYEPVGWLLCDGRVLTIQANAALYSLIGTRYGGDGKTTFALPDLRGYAVTAVNNGPSLPVGLTSYTMGQTVGTVSVATPLPAHTHQMVSGAAPNSAGDPAIIPSPTANSVVSRTLGQYNFAPPTAGTAVGMAPQAVGTVGGSTAHSNLSPYMILAFYICNDGVYPTSD